MIGHHVPLVTSPQYKGSPSQGLPGSETERARTQGRKRPRDKTRKRDTPRSETRDPGMYQVKCSPYQQTKPIRQFRGCPEDPDSPGETQQGQKPLTTRRNPEVSAKVKTRPQASSAARGSMWEYTQKVQDGNNPRGMGHSVPNPGLQHPFGGNISTRVPPSVYCLQQGMPQIHAFGLGVDFVFGAVLEQSWDDQSQATRRILEKY